MKENFEVVSLAPQTDCRANRRCASASEFERDRQSGFAPPHERIFVQNVSNVLAHVLFACKQGASVIKPIKTTKPK